MPTFAGQPVWLSWRGPDLSERPCLKEKRQMVPRKQHPRLPSGLHTHAHTHAHMHSHTHTEKESQGTLSMCSFFITTYDETEVWRLLSQPYINKYLLSSFFGPEILLVIGNTTVIKKI